MFTIFLALIFAADSTYILSPVYVKGKSPGIVKEHFPMTYSIKKPVFKRALYDFLQISGINPRSYVNMTGVSIRGSGMEEIKVLFEGIPVKNPQNGYFNFDIIPSDMIGKTEVLLTGNSSYYGYNSMAGLVNISLPSESNFLKFGVGQGGYFSLTAIGGLVSKRGFYSRFGFSHEATPDVFKTPKNYLKNAGKSSTFIFFDMGTESSSFFVAQTHSIRGIPAIGIETNDTINEYLTFGKLRFGNLSLNFEKWHFEYLPQFQEHSVSNTYSLHFKYQFHRFFKFEFSHEGISSKNLGRHGRSSISTAFNVSQKIGMVYPFVSISGDYWLNYRKLKSSFFCGISCGPGIYLAYSTGYRLPTYNDLYWPETPYAKGNPSLRPEYLSEYELGFRRTFLFFHISVTRFWRKYHDLIKWAPGRGGKWSPFNLENMSIRGIDGAFSFHLWQVRAGFSFEYIDSVISQVHLIYYPLSSWSFTFGVRNLVLAINHVGRRYERLSGPKMMEPFTVINAFFKIPVRSNTIEIGVTNLTNRSYTLVRGYPAPGREWRVKLTTKF